jgi:two-component sensor histidine kinase
VTVRLPGHWSRAGKTRARLVLLAMVAAIPITLMGAIIVLQDFRNITRAAQERAALLDGQGLAQFHAAIASLSGRLAVLSPKLVAGNCSPALLGSLGPDVSAGLLLLDIDGHVTCRLGDVPTLPSGPQSWNVQVRSGAPFALGSLGSAKFAVAAFPAPNQSVVAAILPAGWFGTALLPDNPDADAAAWLLNQDRHVVASRGAAAQALPTGAVMIALVSAHQVTLRALSAAGVRYAYATSELAGGWRLITATSAEAEHTEALDTLLLRAGELALLLLAGLTAVVLGADVAFGAPLRRLSRAVGRWQAGEAFVPGDMTGAPDEVQQLAASFKEATHTLRMKQAELARAQEQQNLLVLEVHHRVKNNLQVIASLLNLQASRIRVPSAKAEFQAARDRVRALATLHRHLYSDGQLHTINMRSFLTELCGQLFQAMGEQEGKRIELVIEAPELRMSSDQAVPLALIVTEAVTNSVKYAFPGGRAGRVSVLLTAHDGWLDLEISDDGVGIPIGKTETESGTRDGIGLQLIRGFSRQLGGTLAVDEAGGGTRYAVRLPFREPGGDAHKEALDAAMARRDIGR